MASDKTGRRAGGENRTHIEPESYVPPPRLLDRIVRRGADDAGQTQVTMPLQAFHKLLEAALAPGFDEALYLDTNEDVKAGVGSGVIASGLAHYAAHGFFEGRGQPPIAVDAVWYLATYPDVQLAIDAGEVQDAAHHFEAFGYREGRVPSARFQQVVGAWQALAQGK